MLNAETTNFGPDSGSHLWAIILCPDCLINSPACFLNSFVSLQKAQGKPRPLHLGKGSQDPAQANRWVWEWVQERTPKSLLPLHMPLFNATQHWEAQRDRGHQLERIKSPSADEQPSLPVNLALLSQHQEIQLKRSLKFKKEKKKSTSTQLF